jgi:hypothetical protein
LAQEVSSDSDEELAQQAQAGSLKWQPITSSESQRLRQPGKANDCPGDMEICAALTL